MPAPIRRSPVHTGRVVDTAQLTPRMRRVVVQSDAMRAVPIRPAQDVELHLREESGRRVKRRYTIRNARSDIGELDLDVVLHGDGPGARWAAAVGAGDEVAFQGPRGKLVLSAADWHLLCGDESAVPAIAAICAAMERPTIAVLECADPSDELPVAGDVRWVHRGGHPPGTPELLRTALDAIELPAGRGHGYLLGETRSMVALRAALEARGLEPDAIFVKGYWNVGRPDRIEGRTPQRG